VVVGVGSGVVVPPPYVGIFGPGPNAPQWSNKRTYPEELFTTPVPVEYSVPNVAGFKGWQGFDGAWGITYNPTRVSYPIVNTPLGTKHVLEVKFPGSSRNISTANELSNTWPTNQAWAVRVTGSWSGTLIFERSADGVVWTPVSLKGTRAGTGLVSQTGSQTNVNGVWASGDSLSAAGGSFRVRAVSLVSGSANVAVGMEGGAASARMSAGGFIDNPTKIYTRAMIFIDPNWTNGGNVGTKFFFFSKQEGNNHYTTVFGGMENEMNSRAFVGLQQTSFRNIQGPVGPSNGAWVDAEFLFIANTPGVSNGVAKVWINGVEAINTSEVMFFAAGKTPGFSSLWMDPTYGGGVAPPPRDVFFRLAGWYRESAP
jgi:hypothetical protein